MEMDVHDRYMYIWPLIIEIVMWVYLLNKSRLTIKKEAYDDLSDAYVDQVTTRNLLVITLFYLFFMVYETFFE